MSIRVPAGTYTVPVRLPKAARFALTDRRGRTLEIDRQNLTVVNPRTNRPIRIDGETYKELVRRGDIVEDVSIGNTQIVARRRSAESARATVSRRPRSARFSLNRAVDDLLPQRFDASPTRRTSGPGCGNAKRYSRADEPFCGAAGGSCPNTYPVRTRRQTTETLQRARYAPDPPGVRACARLQQIRQGWLPRSVRHSRGDYDVDELSDAYEQRYGAGNDTLRRVLNPISGGGEPNPRQQTPRRPSFFQRFFGLA